MHDQQCYQPSPSLQAQALRLGLGTPRSAHTDPLSSASGQQQDPSHSSTASVAHAGQLDAAAHAQGPHRVMSQSMASTSLQSRSSQHSIPASLFLSYPISPQTPSGRWAHAAAVVPGRGLLIMGGIGSALLDDTALLEAETLTWRLLQTSAGNAKDQPDKCMGHSCAYLEHKVWYFGGQQGRKLISKLYSLSTDNWAWRRHNLSTLPSPRAGHAMVTVDRHAAIYMFGGQSKKLLNDLHVMTIGDGGMPIFTELPVQGQAPSPRRGHSLVWDGGDLLIVFGGTHATGIDNTLHMYSLSRREWFVPSMRGACPSPRTQHTAAMLNSHAMLVFGGCNAQGVFFNDFHILDTATFTWSQPTLLNASPAPRYHHSCVVLNGRAVIYGGINSKGSPFDGIVVVDSRFDNPDISHIAEELTMMASSSLPPASAASLMHTPDPSIRGHSSSLPRMSPATSVMGDGMMMDLMKAQLTDLLVKRNMEEMQVLMARKAESAEAALAIERERLDATNKDLAAMKMIMAEAEASRDAAEVRCEELGSRLARESAALAEARSQLAAARSELAGTKNELTGAQALQQGLIKELGILSSRYTRLYQHYQHHRRQAGGRPTIADGRSSAPGQERAASRDDSPPPPPPPPSAFATDLSALIRSGPDNMISSLAGLSVSEPVTASMAANSNPMPDPRACASAASSTGLYGSIQDSMPDVPRCGSPSDGADALPSTISSLNGSPQVGASPVALSVLAGACQAAEAQVNSRGLSMSRAFVMGAESPADDGADTAAGGGGGASASHDRAPITTKTTASSNSSDAACSQLLRLLNVAEQQRAMVVEQLAMLQSSYSSLINDNELSKVELEESKVQLQQCQEELAKMNAQLERVLAADPGVLATLPIPELHELESALEAGARRVRAEVVRRAMEQATRRTQNEAACCGVCLEGPRSVVFSCGHQSCDGCAAKVDICPFCRAAITAKIKLFDVLDLPKTRSGQ